MSPSLRDTDDRKTFQLIQVNEDKVTEVADEVKPMIKPSLNPTR